MLMINLRKKTRGDGISMQVIRVLTNAYVQDLAKAVNRSLAEGYTIVGPVSAIVRPSGSIEYIATVVKNV